VSAGVPRRPHTTPASSHVHVRQDTVTWFFCLISSQQFICCRQRSTLRLVTDTASCRVDFHKLFITAWRVMLALCYGIFVRPSRLSHSFIILSKQLNMSRNFAHPGGHVILMFSHQWCINFDWATLSNGVKYRWCMIWFLTNIRLCFRNDKVLSLCNFDGKSCVIASDFEWLLKVQVIKWDSLSLSAVVSGLWLRSHISGNS